MSFSETGEISRMMRTCQTLYLAGVPYILDGSVQILSAKKFFSFCMFMLHDPARRFRHLRDLELHVEAHTIATDDT